MSIIEPTTQFGVTIFCDDFRQDAQGKFIYTGVYPSDMIVFGEPPIYVPSFWVVPKYSFPRATASGTATLRIFGPNNDEPLFETELNLGEVDRNLPVREPIDGASTGFMTSFVPVRLAPLLIEKEGLLRVRVYREDDEIRIGALHVVIAPLPTASPPTPFQQP